MKPSYFCWQNLLFADETELTVPQLAGDQWVSMNGTNMKFSISDASAPGLDLGADGSSFAIEVIITTPETMPSSLVRIGGKDAPGIYAFFLEYRNTADMMQFYIASSSTTAAVDMQPAGGWAGGTKYRLNMYFHSGNKLVGFIDGTKVAETTTAITTVKNSSSDFHVGARSDNSRYWPGKIHQFRIAKNWGSFPTDGSELDPDRDNLISDWIFDGLNGAGGTVKDNSSSGYHLTPTNVTGTDFTVIPPEDISGLGDFQYTNLSLRKVRPGWRFEPSSTEPMVVKLNFTSNKFFNLLYIDRRHSFTETTKLTFLFSNISNEAEDATEQVIFDYGDIAPGEPIIKRLEEYDRIYQYVTLQILDSNSANIDYHEINWLTVGVLERFGKGYAPQFHWGDPSDGVRNSDYLGNPRTQRRTEPFRIYGGYLPTIDVGEDKEKLDQLQRWAFGFPFVFCFDHSTVEQEAEHSRTVYWEDAASYQLDVIIPRTNYNNERANVNFALREEATIAEPVRVKTTPPPRPTIGSWIPVDQEDASKVELGEFMYSGSGFHSDHGEPAYCIMSDWRGLGIRANDDLCIQVEAECLLSAVYRDPRVVSFQLPVDSHRVCRALIAWGGQPDYSAGNGCVVHLQSPDGNTQRFNEPAGFILQSNHVFKVSISQGGSAAAYVDGTAMIFDSSAASSERKAENPLLLACELDYLADPEDQTTWGNPWAAGTVIRDLKVSPVHQANAGEITDIVSHWKFKDNPKLNREVGYAPEEL